MIKFYKHIIDGETIVGEGDFNSPLSVSFSYLYSIITFFLKTEPTTIMRTVSQSPQNLNLFKLTGDSIEIIKFYEIFKNLNIVEKFKIYFVFKIRNSNNLYSCSYSKIILKIFLNNDNNPFKTLEINGGNIPPSETIRFFNYIEINKNEISDFLNNIININYEIEICDIKSATGQANIYITLHKVFVC